MDASSSPSSKDLACAQASLQDVDITKLNACACKPGGKAHCVATSSMPQGFSKLLEPCDGAGACVPDTILQGEVPKKCASSGDEGRCLSLCVPNVAEYADTLTRGDGDVCPADERCIPCINPATSKPTGICEIGKAPADECGQSKVDLGAIPTGASTTVDGEQVTCPFRGKPMDVSSYNVCAPGGRCLKETQLDNMVKDPKKRQQLKDRLATCDAGVGFCVPEEYLKEYGQHLPTECRSVAGIEGRCFSTVFKDIAAKKDLLHQDACNDHERCIPCFNPATGEPTGACKTVSCDQPKTATAPQLKDCCEKDGQMRGKCIAKTDVPTQYQSRLETHECNSDGELCAPSDNLNPNVKPVICDAIGDGKGVCVSDCIAFRFVEKILTSRGSCNSAQTCVPCIHPRTKEPTGAPGC